MVLVTGPNGGGKTNLLEALHLGTQGFSPRTRSDAQLVRRGTPAARIALQGLDDGRRFQTDIAVSLRDTRRARLNGASLSSAEQLRHSFRTLAFTPDRLAVVKGGPAIRRAYVDRSLSRLLPGRASLPSEYAAAVVQRNAALRRVAAGHSSREALSPWTERVATVGQALVEARSTAVEVLARLFTTTAAELGLADAELAYEGDPPTTAALELRLERDLERGTTGLGPHLHDLGISAGRRDLRGFGSQGEQRTAVLALVLAEAAAITERSGATPLVLLDDVLSELDEEHRRALAGILARGGQMVVTATSADAFPGDPSQALAVNPGEVRSA